jgi:trk system potassium uptake protein TrkA
MITRENLMNLELPKGVLIAAVLKGNSIEIATGLTQIEAGDRAYVFVLPGMIGQAEKLFDR